MAGCRRAWAATEVLVRRRDTVLGTHRPPRRSRTELRASQPPRWRRSSCTRARPADARATVCRERRGLKSPDCRWPERSRAGRGMRYRFSRTEDRGPMHAPGRRAFARLPPRGAVDDAGRSDHRHRLPDRDRGRDQRPGGCDRPPSQGARAGSEPVGLGHVPIRDRLADGQADCADLRLVRRDARPHGPVGRLEGDETGRSLHSSFGISPACCRVVAVDVRRGGCIGDGVLTSG
jgi:hypothetical protein